MDMHNVPGRLLPGDLVRTVDPCRGANAWTVDAAIKKIHAALGCLGSTSGAVAKRLALLGCRGERGNPRLCPTIVYLRKQRLGSFELMLFDGWLEISGLDGWVERFRVPVAVEWCERRFDQGEFPDLAAPGSRAYVSLYPTVPFVADETADSQATSDEAVSGPATEAA